MSSQPTLEPPPNEVVWRHWLGLVFIGVLAVTTLPAWNLSSFSADGSAQAADVYGRMLAQLASFYLLPAMGFWLALRRGAVDLSVWAVAGLGGLLAAMLINAGLPVAGAFALAVLAGLAVGTVNGLVAAWTRFSSPAFTLIVAAVIVAGAGLLVPQRFVRVPDETFGSPLDPDVADAWADSGKDAGGSANRPLSSEELRMALVAVAYSAVMVVLLSWGIASSRRRRPSPDPVGVFAAMAASGALAAAAGAFWLVDHGSAPVPTRLIGDLRIPAAAILAGGILWVGNGRTLLSGLFLPVSVLLVTSWRQEVTALAWLRSSGYALQLILLIGMMLSAHLAFLGVIRARGPRRTGAGVCLAMIVLALASVACQSLLGRYAARSAVELGCLAVWAGAAGGAVFCALRAPLSDPRTG